MIIAEEVQFISTRSEEMAGLEIVENTHYTTVPAELTFYTSLGVCNGSNVGKNAIGGTLSETSIAIPRRSMAFGTELFVETFPESFVNDYGDDIAHTRYADDVGNPNYIRIKDDGVWRFDIYCPRLSGEDDSQYWNRIMSYGRWDTQVKVFEE